MAYALDLLATNPANFITTNFTRDTVDGPWFFVMPGGVFYTKDLSVTNVFTGKLMTPMTQYVALELNKDATMASNKETCTIILIKDASVNEVSIKRRVVGGVYSTIGSDLESIITEDDLTALKSTAWAQIVGKPYQYPFDPHKHYEEDIYGLEHVIYLLDEIRKAIQSGDSKAFGMFYQYVDQLSATIRTEVQDKIDALENEIEQLRGSVKREPGFIVIYTNNTNPRDDFKYGTWRRLEDTLLYAVGANGDLGIRKKVGEGTDHLMTGFVMWELVSI